MINCKILADSQHYLSVDIKILSLLLPGAMYMWKLPGAMYMWKNVKKRVEIVLKLATNGQSDKGFLLTSTFVPKGLSAPALGIYTCIKALIDIQSTLFIMSVLVPSDL